MRNTKDNNGDEARNYLHSREIRLFGRPDGETDRDISDRDVVSDKLRLRGNGTRSQTEIRTDGHGRDARRRHGSSSPGRIARRTRRQPQREVDAFGTEPGGL